jgi:osmotically inducible lipoprotein OsmB
MRAGTLPLVIVIAGGLTLAGCGTMPGDRMASGGLLGAGTGALIGSVAGSVGKGALIGGVAGAAIGALTTANQIDLGPPPWRHYSARRTHRHYASNDPKCTTRETATETIRTCPKGKR